MSVLPYTIFDTPPDVINLRLNSVGDFYFEPPEALSFNLYGAASWTAANVGSFTAANVNDGSIASAAFNINVAADSTLTFDSGAGNTKMMTGVTVWYQAAGVGGDWCNVVEYSDDMSTWTAVTNLAQLLVANTGTPSLGGNPVSYGWVFAGPHRGWRIRKNNSTAFNDTIYEVQFHEGDGPRAAIIDHYQVIDLRTSNPRVYSNIQRAEIPTSAKGIGLAQLTQVNSDGTRLANFTIVAVTIGGIKSAGLAYSSSGSTGRGVIFSDSSIAIGQTAYNTGVGFWLGLLSGVAKLSLGSAGGNSLTFDGTNLTITGTITATAGAIGGWTISGGELVGSLSVACDIRIGATGFQTGTGFFVGNVGGVAKLSIGSNTNNLVWDGSSLSINGNLTVVGQVLCDTVHAKASFGNGYILADQDLRAAGAPAGSSGVSYGGTTATTVGAAGAAAALPANPLGYINIKVGATTAKIPYYNS